MLEQELERRGCSEVQATTGPGNLTRSVFEVVTNESCPEEVLFVVHDWEKTSTSKVAA